MALSGLHVLCAYPGNPDGGSVTKQPLLRDPQWSETLPAGGPTTQSAPSSGCVFRIRTSVAAWFAIGTAPDAGQAVGNSGSKAREYLDPADGAVDRFVGPGEKLAWVAA